MWFSSFKFDFNVFLNCFVLFFSLVYVGLFKATVVLCEPGSLANCSFFSHCVHVFHLWQLKWWWWWLLLQDVHRYTRLGELRGSSIVRGLISHCIQRPELRDELYCQLIRMTTDNPAPEDQLCRIWTMLCLCAVSFSPSRTLRKVSCLILVQYVLVFFVFFVFVFCLL